MATNRYNIDATIGSNLMLRVAATDQNGTALNLSGFSVRGKVRYSYGSTGILLDLNPSIYHAGSGLVDIMLSGNVTSSMVCGTFPYDLECAISGAPNESVVKFLKGYIEFGPEATY